MLYLILFRLFAGIQNALYYAKMPTIARFWSAILFAYIIWLLPGWWGLSAVGVLFAVLAFEEKLWTGSIHLVEIFKTTIPIICYFLAGGNAVDIVLATYPGLILHKIVINIGSGQKWLSDVTDDPTGKSFTFTLPIGWKWTMSWLHYLWFGLKGNADARQAMYEDAHPGWTKIYVPRKTMLERMIWAGVSILFYFLVDVEFTIDNILNLFK